jgi:hypothetical protein
VSLRHRRHRVALLPLDDRPFNTKLVRLLGRMVDYDVALPPVEMLGHFDDPGDPEALIQWVQTVAPETDTVLLSLDMLAYGGHVASCQPHVRPDAALQRLEFLGELREKAPEHAIYGLATVPPPEGMPLAGGDVGESRAIARYAQLQATMREQEAAADPEAADEMEHLRASVSPDFWSHYHEMRRRNLEVNLKAVELAADGVLDFLIVAQEGNGAVGPHVDEADELLAAVADRRASGSVILVDGYSQSAAVMLVRFVHAHMETSPAVATVFSFPPPGGPDGALASSVRSQIAALGASEVDEPGDADICLYVNTPAGLSLGEAAPGTQAFDERKHALHQFAINLSGWVASDRLAALADAAFPSAADEALMRALHEVKVDLTRLGGFAARETPGASVGAALAHICLRRIALRDKGAFDLAQAVGDLRPMRYLELLDSLIDSERAHIALLFERFVEDYLFQSRIKQRAASYLADLIAKSPISLTEIPNSADQFIRTALSRAAGEFYIEHFLGRQAVAIGRGDHRSGLMLCELGEVRVRLPWRRLAEVDVDLDFDIQLVAEPAE